MDKSFENLIAKMDQVQSAEDGSLIGGFLNVKAALHKDLIAGTVQISEAISSDPEQNRSCHNIQDCTGTSNKDCTNDNKCRVIPINGTRSSFNKL